LRDTLTRSRWALGEDHPRHPGLRQQPRLRPDRAGASTRRPGSWTRTTPTRSVRPITSPPTCAN